MEVQDQHAKWLFAAEYAEKYDNLPPSQQREALKRLTTRRRNPLSAEQCREPNPDIAAVLEAVFNAYNSKKLRSKAGSATRRATALSNVAARACVQLEPEAVVEPVDAAEADCPPPNVCHDTADAPASVIVCAIEPEVVRAAPLVDAAPPLAAKPIAKPRVARIPNVRSAAIPVVSEKQVPKTMAKKAVSGLAAMLAR